ncbi:MAG: hypothetical protein QOG52_1794 [Frankiaceae bacterium]|nr:hypothetical protein [Frankiaceae bacterium]
MEIPSSLEPVQAVAVLDRLLDADLDTRSDTQLADDLRELQVLRNRLDGEFARRLGAFDARGGAASEHSLSTKAWLRGNCHLSSTVASGRVAIARRLRTEGPLQRALRAGLVSYEHAVVVTHALDRLPAAAVSAAEEILVATARSVDPGRLGNIADTIRETLAPELLEADADAARERRFLNVSTTIDGLVVLNGLFDPESGAGLHAAVHALATPKGPDDHRTACQRRADALTEIIAAGLAAGMLPATGGQRPQVALTVDIAPFLLAQHRIPNGHEPLDAQEGDALEGDALEGDALEGDALEGDVLEGDALEGDALEGDALEGDAQEGDAQEGDAQQRETGAFGSRLAPAGASGIPVGHTPYGGVLAGETVRRILCDASVHRIVTIGPSDVLDVGRSTRIVPPAIRRALAIRDGGCVADDCDRPAAWTDAHHVIHWSEGGPTALTNLVLLCRVHHILVHEHGWIVERSGAGFTIRPPNATTPHPPPHFHEPNPP